MRVHVVSDVHGAATSLASAGDGAHLVICLGDLVVFTDYANPGRGVMGTLFGANVAAEYIRLRTAGQFAQARQYADRHWQRLPGDRDALIGEQIAAQYDALFAALPTPALLIYGNVDVPALWPPRLRAGHRVCDGEVVEIAGVRFGFIGGGLRTRYRTPYELDDGQYADRVAGLGPVDVLCSHIPCALPEITYDVIARRFERGSEALLAYVRQVQPRLHLHGHVHQPLRSRQRVGRTECINVGHFAATGTPFRLDLP